VIRRAEFRVCRAARYKNSADSVSGRTGGSLHLSRPVERPAKLPSSFREFACAISSPA
jgi:hypothetical protein